MNDPSIIPELSVTNFEKSLSFYTHIIGFHILYEREEEGFAMLKIGNSQLMIDQIGKTRTWETAKMHYPFGRGINFQIEVSSIQPVINRLKKEHIPLFMQPEEKWYTINETTSVGNKQFLVQDPDGYLLRIFEDLGKKRD